MHIIQDGVISIDKTEKCVKSRLKAYREVLESKGFKISSLKLNIWIIHTMKENNGTIKLRAKKYPRRPFPLLMLDCS